MPKVWAGLIGIIVILAVSYGAYTKFANPFASHFTVNATFANANLLRPGSLVRIAGVNVGTVTGIAPETSCKQNGIVAHDCQAALVTMRLQGNGLPIHRDATFWIRPRIFLEGNFFVDVFPGSPSAPTVSNGHTFPIQAGREPVQFDQLLTSLQNNTRRNLQILLEEYGTAVKVGGPAYNQSIDYWKPAYEFTAIVNHDFLGYAPHDLSNYISSSATVAGALDAHPQNLENLITNLRITAGAFARQSINLQAAVAELPKTLSAAMPALTDLNRAFPPLRALARALIPGVRSTGPTVDASLPFIRQLRLLVQPSELRGLTSDLSVAVPALAKLTVETIPFMKQQVRPAASCVVNQIIPWSHLTVPDSHFNASNGFPARQVYVEGVDFLPGLAGESRNFDANGPYIRILLTGGTFTYSLSPGLFGQALAPLQGVQPGLGATTDGKGERPPLHARVACETQQTITQSDLATPVQGPASQINTGGIVSSNQAAKVFQQNAAQGALDTLIHQAHDAGLGVQTTPSGSSK
jgi:phospholipid/cholesterol/gamma-HCH transport system substrate-binding protein